MTYGAQGLVSPLGDPTCLWSLSRPRSSKSMQGLLKVSALRSISWMTLTIVQPAQ